jgi:hypothetical protein
MALLAAFAASDCLFQYLVGATPLAQLLNVPDSVLGFIRVRLAAVRRCPAVCISPMQLRQWLDARLCAPFISDPGHDGILDANREFMWHPCVQPSSLANLS